MTIHKMELEWDCIGFTIQCIKKLQQNDFTSLDNKEFTPIMSMSNDGKIAFIIGAKLENNVIRIIANNNDKEIEISQGKTNTEKPINQKLFKSTEQILAKDFLHKMIIECMK